MISFALPYSPSAFHYTPQSFNLLHHYPELSFKLSHVFPINRMAPLIHYNIPRNNSNTSNYHDDIRAYIIDELVLVVSLVLII